MQSWLALKQAKQLVTDLAEGQAAWSIPWPCIYEFFSVVTNPRIWKESATKPERAKAQFTAWLESPTLDVLSETRGILETLAPLLSLPRVRGPVVHDARIAAFDRDFRLFPGLRIKDPFN